MPSLIEVSHLTKTLGHTCAVTDVSFQVESGMIFGLVGPDGAGKTTTMRLLCGALRPTAGEVTVAGYRVDRQPEQARAQLGYLPQVFSLYEELTVLENLRFFAEMRGLTTATWRPYAQSILEFVGLDPFVDRRAGWLSGGMRQKLGLAVALVNRPRILLLDEPTTGVDPVTRQDFWQLILRLAAKEGIAVLVTTPYMDEAARCARLGFMCQGRLLLEGTPAELCRPLQGRVLELQGQPLPLLLRLAATDDAVAGAQRFGDRLHLRLRECASPAVVERLGARLQRDGAEVSALRPVAPQLEDVFISLVETQAHEPAADITREQ